MFQYRIGSTFSGRNFFLTGECTVTKQPPGLWADLPSGGELPLPAVAVTLRGALEPRALGHSQSLRGLVLEV